ncbi:MAG: hypothetical protein QM687_04955 [Ferruginibacter sp.]
MKTASLWRALIFLLIVIVVIGGIIIIIIIRGPIPDPVPCAVCGIKSIKYLAVAEILAGILSLGIVNRLRNIEKF